MRKLSWDLLDIELTRRCQLKCAHCYKGDAQALDISEESLDNILKQTELRGLKGGGYTRVL